LGVDVAKTCSPHSKRHVSCRAGIAVLAPRLTEHCPKVLESMKDEKEERKREEESTFLLYKESDLNPALQSYLAST
jgi:hypothetical protein